jgi:hypothetical protein
MLKVETACQQWLHIESTFNPGLEKRNAEQFVSGRMWSKTFLDKSNLS